MLDRVLVLSADLNPNQYADVPCVDRGLLEIIHLRELLFQATPFLKQTPINFLKKIQNHIGLDLLYSAYSPSL